MPKRTFFLPIEPFSINNYHYRDKRHKTREAKDWETRIFFQLSKSLPQKALAELRELFDPENHMYIVHLTALYPASIYFTAQGVISQRTLDITNFEKPFIDLLFLPKHFLAPEPYGCKNLNVDDKYLYSMRSTKKASKDGQAWLRVSIAIVEAPKEAGPL